MIDRTKKLPVTRQCKLLAINRSTAYYKPKPVSSEDLALMRRLDELHMKRPFAGSRMLRDFLRQDGMVVNRKKVQRLMRKMGLLALYPKKRTSIPGKGHKIYPYLLRDLTIDHPNQGWCTDITYIPLARGFGYLVAIMDWYSRKVLSWRFSNTLDADFCVEALDEALARYGPPEIFNTDQGSQFTSSDFTGALLERGILVSMDGRGRVFDNIFVERLWRSVKYENVYIHGYQAVPEARSGLKQYFELYDFERLHESLDYQTPWEIYSGIGTLKPENSIN